MLCQNCNNNEATVRYTQIINGVKKEMMLCEKCSKALEVENMNFNMPIDFSSFFGDFLSQYDTSNFIPMIAKPKNLKCNVCNMSYDEFVTKGKFGCSNCYDVFSEKIDPILKRLHGNNRHVGRKGKISKIQESKDINNDEILKNCDDETKIRNLKNNLKQLIKEEKYEEAAKVRDEIKRIENQK